MGFYSYLHQARRLRALLNLSGNQSLSRNAATIRPFIPTESFFELVHRFRGHIHVVDLDAPETLPTSAGESSDPEYSLFYH